MSSRYSPAFAVVKVADTDLCGYLPGGAADKQLCIAQFNDCRDNVPGAAHDCIPDSVSSAEDLFCGDRHCTGRNP
jgi:hypothetical protein